MSQRVDDSERCAQRKFKCFTPLGLAMGGEVMAGSQPVTPCRHGDRNRIARHSRDRLLEQFERRRMDGRVSRKHHRKSLHAEPPGREVRWLHANGMIDLRVTQDRTKRARYDVGKPIRRAEQIARRTIRAVRPDVAGRRFIEQGCSNPQRAGAVILHLAMQTVARCANWRDPEPTGSAQSRGDLLIDVTRASRLRPNKIKRQDRKRRPL